MTKELLPGLLAVEVSANIYDAFIGGGDTPFCERPDDEYLCVRHDGSGTNIALPPGTWSIIGIGTADKITEDEWAGVIKEGFEDSDTFDSGTQYSRTERWVSYWDYETESYEFDTRTASGLSLLKLHDLNPETTVLLTSKTNT